MPRITRSGRASSEGCTPDPDHLRTLIVGTISTTTIAALTITVIMAAA